ncbi:MAG: STAS domain-containing protein [Hymenobacteraceae bacterium]|nr:STAS domain-containing protein [Hymenobacteraceae bacterium]MDX5482489.1 STAS domain-containing protein [Hymenobacteraceae bacterium]
MKRFKTEIDQQTDISIIKVAGELDANTAVVADNSFTEAIATVPSVIVVDLTELQYISSAGLGVILAAFHECRSKGIHLLFFGLQPKTKNVLEILGLEKVITIFRTREEALQAARNITGSTR